EKKLYRRFGIRNDEISNMACAVAAGRIGGVMKIQPAAFVRTTLPLDLSKLDVLDSGRYHSVWLPDHMVSFWPESLWSPEFTDLATVSASPHRHLDAMVVAG